MLVAFQEFKYRGITLKLKLESSHGTQVIYLSSVLKAFGIQDAAGYEANVMFKADGVIIDYIYHQKRIQYIPGCVIEVIYKTPQTDSTSLAPTTARESSVSLDESVDQLSIKSQLSSDLDPSEPLHFGLPRISVAQIRGDMKVATCTAIAGSCAGKALNAHFIADLSLPDEYHTSVVTNVTVKPEFESRVMGKLEEIHKDVKKNLELSKQMNDRLILIQNKTEAILTQQLELAEYPIPRLFIVLPEEPTKYDPGNWFRTKFRLHFICECGEHTKATGSNTPNHLHLAKHEGYLIREPTAFFKKYGPFLLLMLGLIKFGTNIAGYVVPALANLKVVELADSVQQTVESVMARIDYSLDCIDKQLAKVQELSPGDFIDSETRGAVTQQELINYLSDVEGLEGVELRQLGSFLKTSQEGNLLGNLYRMATSSGHVKWVCRDHYRASYQEKQTQKLRDVVKLAQGEFDEQMGKITITLTSSIAAAEFYSAISKAKGVLELALSLSWECTTSDLERLEVALKNTRVSILWIDLQQFRTSLLGRLSSAQHVLLRIMQQLNMKMIHIILPKVLINPPTFPSKRPSHLCELSFQTAPGSIRRKELKVSSEALKTNSSLTTLNLYSSNIGGNGAQVLAEALKTNSTLTTLDLRSNFIRDSGGQSLAEALKTNSTLTTLDLGSNLIGDSGGQSLAEALKTNSTLTTLNLRSNLIGDGGGQALAEALKANSTLTILDLRNNNIRDSGSHTLAEALKTNLTLTILDLEGNKIGFEGILSLTLARKVNSTLVALNLIENSINDTAASALAEAFHINSTVTTLNLENNSIGDSGGQLLAEALKTNSTLTTLDLGRNSIRDSGGQALAEAFKTNSTLTTLNLWRNSIGDSG
ncbi:hypothetical protein BGZ79_001988, partial [Entomortierella chlamydospora]